MGLLKNLSWRLLLILLLPMTLISVAYSQQMPYYYGVSIGNGKFSQAGGGDPTMSIYLGNYLSENFAIEGGYAMLGEGGQPGASVSLSSFYGGGLLTLNSIDHPEVSGFITGGLSSWYYKSGTNADEGVDLYYGVGGAYALSKTLAFRMSYQIFVANPRVGGTDLDEEVRVISFGGQYRPE